jgi:hypothetical protein
MPSALVLGFRNGLHRASGARAAKVGAVLGIFTGLTICLVLALT